MAAGRDRSFKVGVCTSLLAFLIQIIAVFIPWWAYVETDFFGDLWQTNYGLWKICNQETTFKGEKDTTCEAISDTDDYVLRTRTTQTLTLIMMGIGFGAVCVQRCIHTEWYALSMFGAIMFVIAGIVSWIGLITYSGAFPTLAGSSMGSLHAGFWLAFLAVIIIFFTGVTFTYRQIKGY